MRDSAGKKDLESLDEIDIDSILSGSIGTSGKPDVPSAHEPLPSLYEDDIVDIESILQELNAVEETSSPDLTLSDTVDLLRLVEEDVSTETLGILIDPEEIIREPLPEQESAAPEEHTPVPTPLENTALELPTDEQLSFIEISTLLTQESEIMYIGPTPIPELPDSLPASSTRQFLTRPKHPLSYQQKRGLAYISGILIWMIFASHISLNVYRKHQVLMHPPIAPPPLAKITPAVPLKPKEPSKNDPAPVPPKTVSTTEAVSPPNGLEQKDGIENFEPLQCDLNMDSKTLREDLHKCLRSAKVIDN